MSEEELNKQYIKNKIQGICQDCMWFDKTIPIINKMLSEAYISGLEQGKFDLKMDLQQKVEQLENIRKEAIEYMKENCDIITIDKGWIIRSELTTTGLGKLFKILNKGR